MKREGTNAPGSRQSFSCRCNSHGAIRITSPFFTGKPAMVSGPAAARAIKKAGGPNLDKRTVQLPKAHIKSVGTHPIAVRLHPDVDASVSLSVVAV